MLCNGDGTSHCQYQQPGQELDDSYRAQLHLHSHQEYFYAVWFRVPHSIHALPALQQLYCRCRYCPLIGATAQRYLPGYLHNMAIKASEHAAGRSGGTRQGCTAVLAGSSQSWQQGNEHLVHALQVHKARLHGADLAQDRTADEPEGQGFCLGLGLGWRGGEGWSSDVEQCWRLSDAAPSSRGEPRVQAPSSHPSILWGGMHQQYQMVTAPLSL